MPTVIDHRDVVRANPGLTLTSDEITALDMDIIPSAQGELESWLNRRFGVAEIEDEEHLLDYGARSIHLRTSPVFTVGSFGLSSYPKDDPNSVTYDISDRDFIVQRWGIELIGYTGTLVPTVATVTYTAGIGSEFDEPRWNAIRGVLIARASREVTNVRQFNEQDTAGATGLKALSVEGYSQTWETPRERSGASEETAVGGFTSTELRALQRMRRPVVR